MATRDGRANKSSVKTGVLSYPTSVVDQDGHYIIFKIFEKSDFNYDSPYVQVDQPTQLVNSLLTGLRGALTSKISAIRNKLTSAIGKTAAGGVLTGNFKDKLNTGFNRKSKIFTAWGQKGKAAKDKNVGNICLYTPPTVNVAHKMDYENADITPIGAIIKGVENFKNMDYFFGTCSENRVCSERKNCHFC